MLSLWRGYGAAIVGRVERSKFRYRHVRLMVSLSDGDASWTLFKEILTRIIKMHLDLHAVQNQDNASHVAVL